MSTKYDPGYKMTNPRKKDYLYPGESSLSSGVYGSDYGGYGGSGSGSGGSSSSYSTSSLTTPTYSSPTIGKVPTFTTPTTTAAPEYGGYSYRELPSYSAPAWDESKIDALTQKRAAPGLRALKQTVQKATARRYDNPQVGRMTLRDALQGYGSGVSSVIGTAGTTAASEYGQKYSRDVDNAKAAYSASAAQAAAANTYASDVAKTNYQGDYAKWQLENQTALDAAKTNYTGSLAQWAAKNSAAETAASKNFDASLSTAELKNKYALEESAYESAWDRWKKQQKYISSLDEDGSSSTSWSPNSKTVKRLRGY